MSNKSGQPHFLQVWIFCKQGPGHRWYRGIVKVKGHTSGGCTNKRPGINIRYIRHWNMSGFNLLKQSPLVDTQWQNLCFHCFEDIFIFIADPWGDTSSALVRNWNSQTALVLFIYNAETDGNIGIVSKRPIPRPLESVSVSIEAVFESRYQSRYRSRRLCIFCLFLAEFLLSKVSVSVSVPVHFPGISISLDSDQL